MFCPREDENTHICIAGETKDDLLEQPSKHRCFILRFILTEFTVELHREIDHYILHVLDSFLLSYK